MDEEVRRAIRTIIRGGPACILTSIQDLQQHLADQKRVRPLCGNGSGSYHWNGNAAVEGNIFGYIDVRIEEDFLRCIHCGEAVDSSIRDCCCDARPINHLYMIGDRDKMRSRCRTCNGVVSS